MAEAIAAGQKDSFQIAMMLAQAHRANGHRVEALKYYGRALDLSDSPRPYLLIADAIKQLSSLD